MIALDMMTADPKTVPVTATLRDALAALTELDVRHLPVIDEDDNVVGMLSDRDLRDVPRGPWRRGEPGAETAALDAPVSAVMSGGVIVVEPETDLGDVIDVMLEQRVGAVPVVDPERGLVGIVSYIDVLRALRPAA